MATRKAVKFDIEAHERTVERLRDENARFSRQLFELTHTERVLTNELALARQHQAVLTRRAEMAEKIVAEQHRSLSTLIQVLGEVTPEKEERRAA